MVKTLVKTDLIAGLDGQLFLVRYFEIQTRRGSRRYTADMLIGAGDRIILDDDSLLNLEAKANRLVPATLYSRALAARATAA
jgi:hypothetical protein